MITETRIKMPGDATNYLGGVADVLQVRRANADLEHLGDLKEISMYYDDRQIREVCFSTVSGDTPGYLVRIWLLNR